MLKISEIHIHSNDSIRGLFMELIPHRAFFQKASGLSKRKQVCIDRNYKN